MIDADRQTEINHNRRMANEARFLDRLELLEQAAEPLVGELCREGRVVYYINQRGLDGSLTGKTREFSRYVDATDFLIRNRYV